mmetsp:Transcript_8526/g.14144  ORF Transcript_8526/g.14144 Transcript_8526/m.14144 type:complete len:410 (-) Transcript_8526:305-1534(-)|eukprot:CAMPEP_0119028872 /NCGR_PEP_ID=MMETSP1176-20130426/39713_1 /TAXON_ID=265551 /ORGANISM="Synedropsis recta cf, Strain CCMP1620" /LENGTH=409 /DNA_ID=CAMNT_0006985109 /DNA_START=20 /DNA_END=1249 /DNA_ORIENTATION=-
MTDQVYVSDGDIATELRATVDISPGELLLHEAAFAFACEDDDDDDALPSIVQVAMNALIQADGISTTSSTSTERQWNHLMAEVCTDDDDAQKKALFAWGAEQILSRLAKTHPELALKIEDKDATEAIRRVSLNAFTVKRIDPNGVERVHLDNIADDFELVRAVMQIGKEEEAIGNGLYILASAANHSCSPNTYVTFDANNNITFRATESIKANEAVTISYGPVVGVDGDFLERRSEILASRTHGFVCNCAACLVEEAKATTANEDDDDDDHEDLEATNFIEKYITSGSLTAEEALLKSSLAPESIVQSRMFRQAMSDTSMQSISYDVEIAIGFQKLALKSLELRCSPREDIAIAHEIVTLCLLRLFSEEKQNNVGNDIERARGILSRYCGEGYAYKQILDTLASVGTLQ